MSDEIETIDKNPKSWVAWKRETERLQKIIDDMAAMDSEPVMYASEETLAYAANGEFLLRTLSRPAGDAIIPLYRHAQQPVVPDDVLAALQKVARIRLDLNDFDGDRRGIADCLCDAEEALIEVVNRRAAMLAAAAQPQNAPQNIPEIIPGWIPVSEQMPEREYVLAADFSGKHYSPCQPNTQVGIYADWFDDGNPTWDDGDGNDLHLKQVTHWMPLPAGPQEGK